MVRKGVGLHHVHVPARIIRSEMTYYKTEIHRLKRIHHSNQSQLATVIDTRDYIDHHFEHDLNLDLISKVLCISKYHLLRLFKRYYGQTPKQYLIEKRLEQAKELLKSGRAVRDTCFSIGFESPGSFSTLFKKRIGRTPRQYQKEQFSRR